jgi:hypothetical protein
LILWNNDNWDVPLPEEIMKKYPNEIALDFKDWSSDESYIDEVGDIVIFTKFDNEEFCKVLEINEVQAICDINGKLITLTEFKREDKITLSAQKPIDTNRPIIKNKEDLIKYSIQQGTSPEQAKRSTDAFEKNNPELSIFK